MSERTVRLGCAGAAVIAMVGLIVFALFDDATSRPMSLAGDQLGPDAGETFEDYHARAEDTLADAAPGENVFALVTFAQPLSAGQAGELLGDMERVNTMIIGLAVPRALPEPIDGATRADVFAHELDLIAASLDGAPTQLTAVTAWDDPEAFRRLANDPAVAAVEVLPSDAMWGNFGIRPAEPPGMDLG